MNRRRIVYWWLGILTFLLLVNFYGTIKNDLEYTRDIEILEKQSSAHYEKETENANRIFKLENPEMKPITNKEVTDIYNEQATRLFNDNGIQFFANDFEHIKFGDNKINRILPEYVGFEKETECQSRFYIKFKDGREYCSDELPLLDPTIRIDDIKEEANV